MALNNVKPDTRVCMRVVQLSTLVGRVKLAGLVVTGCGVLRERLGGMCEMA